MNFERINLNRSNIQRSSKCYWYNHTKNKFFYSFISFRFIVIYWVKNNARLLKESFEKIICYKYQRELYMKRLSIASYSISYYQSSKLYVDDSHWYSFSRRFRHSIIVNDRKISLTRKVFTWRSSQYCMNLYQSL